MEISYPSLGPETPSLFKVGVSGGMLEYAAGCGLTAAEIEVYQRYEQRREALQAIRQELEGEPSN